MRRIFLYQGIFLFLLGDVETPAGSAEDAADLTVVSFVFLYGFLLFGSMFCVPFVIDYLVLSHKSRIISTCQKAIYCRSYWIFTVLSSFFHDYSASFTIVASTEKKAKKNPKIHFICAWTELFCGRKKLPAEETAGSAAPFFVISLPLRSIPRFFGMLR